MLTRAVYGLAVTLWTWSVLGCVVLVPGVLAATTLARACPCDNTP